MKAISTVFVFFFTAHIACAQIDEARDAIDRGEYVRAVNILSDTLARNPVPDASDFALLNTDFERRLAIPMFNTLNIPFLTVKWNLFLDGAKTSAIIFSNRAVYCWIRERACGSKPRHTP